MIICSYCGNTSPNDAKFCIECAKPITHNAYTEGTKRLSEYKPSPNPTGAPVYHPFVEYGSSDKAFYIHKNDLGVLLKDPEVYARKTDTGYNIYYHGRLVVLLD